MSVGGIKRFAKPGGERGLSAMQSEMLGRAETQTAKMGNPLLSLFCNKGCYRGGKSAKLLQNRERRDVEQVGKDDRLYAEMAEERDRFLI